MIDRGWICGYAGGRGEERMGRLALGEIANEGVRGVFVMGDE